MYFSLAYDAEWGMLDSFAEAIRQHARCVHCDAPPPIDFAACPCAGAESAGRSRRGRFSFNYRVDHAAWKNTVELLWRKDLRRVHRRNNYEVRRESIQNSDDPPYSAGDVAWLRKVQNDSCYYCGASISGNAQVEHLQPLARGGSNGFRNIMLACPSCNAAKGALSEAQFWRQLRTQLRPLVFQRVRDSAKIMKKRKWCQRD
ncbi:MAG: HNH endonuclease [Chloroflexi bacterium]|nr:HNH endonuclease [Chloroflexota bacterium]